MKRIASFLIVLFLFYGAVATAEETVETRSDSTGTYEYVLLEDGSAEITGYSGDAEVLEIPAELDGYSVTSIGKSAFFHCKNLTSVTIPDSVTSISDYAFLDCYGLTSITLSDSVTSIDEGAFASCCNLTSVNIPDSVTSIGESAFFFCYNLTSVTIPDSVTFIGVDAFSNCSDDLVLTVERDSYAKSYAEENGISYTYPDANDWLNS